MEAGYALDVSFGTAGFTLALARAFEKVVNAVEAIVWLIVTKLYIGVCTGNALI